MTLRSRIGSLWAKILLWQTPSGCYANTALQGAGRSHSLLSQRTHPVGRAPDNRLRLSRGLFPRMPFLREGAGSAERFGDLMTFYDL